MVARVRLLWVPLLLAPAGVVFVVTRTTVDPIASAERLEVVPHLPAAISLPTAAIGITTPERHVAVRVHRATEQPAQHRVAKRLKTRIARAPRPVYVVPRATVSHVAPVTTVTPHASHTPKPKPTPKPIPTPTAAPAPTPPPPTTPEPTPPVQPPQQPPEPPTEPPTQPTPTPAAPPAPAPAPPAPTPAKSEGDDDDDQGEDTGETRPGNGWGDRNHEHTGPPGQTGDHGHKK
jgi:hypothetical protein